MKWLAKYPDITATLIDISATLINISATLQYVQKIGVEYKTYTPTLYMVNRWTSCMITIIYTYQSYLYKVYGYHKMTKSVILTLKRYNCLHTCLHTFFFSLNV